MWIVAGDLQYYPWVMEFETYEEAKKYFDTEDGYMESVYLAEVKEKIAERREGQT